MPCSTPLATKKCWLLFKSQKRSHAKTQRQPRKAEEVDENRVGKEVIDAAIKVHRALGPGLLESVYELCVAHELDNRGFACTSQLPVPIQYEGILFEEGFRADLVVADLVIIELKSVETLLPVHSKQLLTYLRLSGKRLGFLLNFGAPFMKDGIERIVNGLPD
jgi:GxxExxY protein